MKWTARPLLNFTATRRCWIRNGILLSIMVLVVVGDLLCLCCSLAAVDKWETRLLILMLLWLRQCQSWLWLLGLHCWSLSGPWFLNHPPEFPREKDVGASGGKCRPFFHLPSWFYKSINQNEFFLELSGAIMGRSAGCDQKQCKSKYQWRTCHKKNKQPPKKAHTAGYSNGGEIGSFGCQFSLPHQKFSQVKRCCKMRQ